MSLFFIYLDFMSLFVYLFLIFILFIIMFVFTNFLNFVGEGVGGGGARSLVSTSHPHRAPPPPPPPPGWGTSKKIATSDLPDTSSLKGYFCTNARVKGLFFSRTIFAKSAIILPDTTRRFVNKVWTKVRVRDHATRTRSPDGMITQWKKLVPI